jgi:ABC-type multidrug transport system ATPase subunit
MRTVLAYDPISTRLDHPDHRRSLIRRSNDLDPHAVRSARATLRAAADRGAAILMSTHLLGVAKRMCDRILVMDKGKLVADRRGAELQALLNGGPSAVEDFYTSLSAVEGPT